MFKRDELLMLGQVFKEVFLPILIGIMLTACLTGCPPKPSPSGAPSSALWEKVDSGKLTSYDMFQSYRLINVGFDNSRHFLIDAQRMPEAVTSGFCYTIGADYALYRENQTYFYRLLPKTAEAVTQ